MVLNAPDTITTEELMSGTKLLKADDAREICKTSPDIRRYSDISKMHTIMKNIKVRAEKGFYYYDYQANTTYAMAKTLIENGYYLSSSTKPKNKLNLKDFSEGKHYGVRICWKDLEEIGGNNE